MTQKKVNIIMSILIFIGLLISCLVFTALGLLCSLILKIHFSLIACVIVWGIFMAFIFSLTFAAKINDMKEYELLKKGM